MVHNFSFIFFVHFFSSNKYFLFVSTGTTLAFILLLLRANIGLSVHYC